MGTNSDSAKDTLPQRKTISPYDLTSLDNPGLAITQVQLRGENYDEWAQVVKTALRARKKFGFVDGKITQPAEDSSDFEDWWTINFLLVSWIWNSIEPSLRSTISNKDVAKDLWNEIRDRFSVTNGTRIQQLRSALTECKQRGLTIVDYYGRLTKLWDELSNYDPIPTCKCGKCTCDLSTMLNKKREDERVHTFLLGLDDTLYGTEERVKTIARAKEDRVEVMALATRTRSDGRDKTLVCSHCNKNGHEAENCFALIGYPEWWGDRARHDGKATATSLDPNIIHDASHIIEDTSTIMGRGCRRKETSVRLRDFVTHTIKTTSPSLPLPLAPQCSSDTFLQL
ncbi:retrovirus-related Pol polyprotein from transposon TNT 1-94 [Senna tora]|uniref:Retrovirus-related Pol polyprotein from transposon TNT 1-94 n=1 Tax=Senna tora TaxID=362788 RepID=A0A834T919_9FABA|nr:retrovirus-related Pol polyprotein from transposon TNT 1-94 [Senna tora]